jgi:hypothetical protein
MVWKKKGRSGLDDKEFEGVGVLGGKMVQRSTQKRFALEWPRFYEVAVRSDANFYRKGYVPLVQGIARDTFQTVANPSHEQA